MATTAQYTAQPIVEGTSTATTASSTIAAALATSAANGVGKRIIRVYSTVPTTNTAGKLSLFITISGTDYLIAERAVAANTVSATAAALRIEFPEATGLVMPGGSTTSLKITNGLNVTINTTVESGTL
jgi:hypothetical protein